MSHIRIFPGALFQRQYDQAAPIVNASVVIGDITIDLNPTDVESTVVNDTVVTGFTIPADTHYLKITNLGGDTPANITVNGTDLAPGDFIELQAQYKGNEWLYPPEMVVVNASGSQVSYYYKYVP